MGVAKGCSHSRSLQEGLCSAQTGSYKLLVKQQHRLIFAKIQLSCASSARNLCLPYYFSSYFPTMHGDTLSGDGDAFA